jgi:DNA-damage-inducible protein D
MLLSEYEVQPLMQQQPNFISAMQAELESIKGVSSKTGVFYWRARDLQDKLGYDTWERFHGVVERAMHSCQESGIPVQKHFRETAKMVSVGSGAMRSVVDYFLSQHGAHLVAMGGDTSKPEIAFAQMYFSVQTMKQEAYEQMSDEDRRIELRDRVKTHFKKLSGAAVNSGVTTPKMSIFHAAGYQGLYGGRNKSEILAVKGLPPTEDLMDRAGETELSANDFRMTQTKDVLEKKGQIGESAAIDVHRRIGEDVRDAIAKIGGTMPEKLQPEPSIKKIESARKKREKIAIKD